MIFVRFCKFVELSTKLVSVLAFFTGLAYVFYAYGEVRWVNTVQFFVAMLLFDMSTTAINNFIDKRAEGARTHFSTPVCLLLICLMVGISIALGVILTMYCGVVVLLTGMFCFGVGILYTFGPAPISRTPYGELLSGTVMGLCIPFLTIYINLPRNALVEVAWKAPQVLVGVDVVALVRVFVLCIPVVATTANIMLANNICDVEKDVLIKRHTLPYHIGTKHALRLFVALYAIAYAAIAVMSVSDVAPVWCLLSLLTAVPVWKNVKIFLAKQIKGETFVLSVLNLTMLNAAFALTIALGGLF